jgi:uncharacterized protein with FMN-binding domain
MRRAPIVIAATFVGLAGVLAFHTTPSSLNVAALPGAGTLPGASASPQPSPTGAGSQPRAKGRKSSRGKASSPPAASQGAGTRSEVGPSVNYDYGVLSVAVTVSGSKITKVSIASLNDGGNFRSQSIDQESIPILEQQAMQAQSANIQGVSGASYTSAGFKASLQSALQKLGLS